MNTPNAKNVRRAIAAIREQLASGAVAKGERMRSAVDLARSSGLDAAAFRIAYQALYDKGEISGIGYPQQEANLFAGSWSELNDPSFTMPADLAGTLGKRFSYRAEEPGEPLHLKCTTFAADPNILKKTHSHDFHELVFITGGSGQHIHAGQRYPIFSGDCFVVLPGESHGYIGESSLTLTNVIFYADSLAPHERLLADMPGFAAMFTVEPLFRAETSFRDKLHLSLPRLREARELCAHITSELAQRHAGCHLAAYAAFLELVVLVSRAYGDPGQKRGTQSGVAGKQRVIDEAMARIESGSAGEISVPQLARTLFLSKSRLQHVFKESTGLSLTEYLLQVRIDHACKLLRSSRSSVAHISGVVGFHDRAYFSRQFRRKTGMTPLEYRKAELTT